MRCWTHGSGTNLGADFAPSDERTLTAVRCSPRRMRRQAAARTWRQRGREPSRGRAELETACADGRSARASPRSGGRCGCSRGASRIGAFSGLIVARDAADDRVRRADRAVRLRRERPRRAHEAAERHALARHRQPEPRHLEPDHLRRARLHHDRLRHDPARHRRRGRARRHQRVLRRQVRPRRPARRRRVDVVSLPRHHPVRDGGAGAGPAQRGPLAVDHRGRHRLARDPRRHASRSRRTRTWRRRARWAAGTRASCSATSCPT